MTTRSETIHGDLSRMDCLGELIGASDAMHCLYEVIQKVSRTASPILLIGETGTGKELVARAIHMHGPHRDKAFVPVDCSAIVATLAESELFGHVRGAFTGADRSTCGLLKAADGGTLFLDEIGEMPISLQPKLLRALQQNVGSTSAVPCNFRVIAATNRHLQDAVRAGTFREDLFFRLDVIQIRMPPLRERKSDIPLLVTHFLQKSCPPSQSWIFSDEALRRLLAYNWPGNVRELENAISRAIALNSNNILTEEDFASIPEPTQNVDAREFMPMAELKRQAIFQALSKTKGDRVAAAHLLGIGKTTLYRKLKEYNHTPAAI
ncbi:MAG TPA: sigma-54 dependent transcriptional regulator [Candidatus Acidoferrales bacterium]|jgi:two-component system response regulator HydG|nr:sigma-54 dependent transcriptional regulator [Candidatus Acidoferrales bacterium]